MSQGGPNPVSDSGRPTMRDVAAVAGVAVTTVSRVVRGVPTVDPALVAKVQQAADKLGYRPNLTASNLRRSGGRTAMIGMLVEDAANPFSAALIRTVEDAARERGIQVLIGSLDEDPVRERELAESLINRRVDGLVVVPAGQDHSYLMRERRAGTALVFVDREPRLLNADAVVVDNRRGGIKAVEHLLAAGHRRIAYLGDRLSIQTAAQRFDGYLHALEVAHIETDEQIVHHGLQSVEDAMRAVKALMGLPDPPTALFTSQNLVTIGAARTLHGLRLNRSVALIGFDDFPMADIFQPGITVLAQDIDAIGRKAAEILFRRLDGDESPTQTITVPTSLVERGSGEIKIGETVGD